MRYITVMLWLPVLLFGAALSGTFFFVLHARSPLNNTTLTLSRGGITMIYLLVAYSILSTILVFTPAFKGIPVYIPVLFAVFHALVNIAGAECSYFLSRKHKWFKPLAFLSLLISTCYFSVSLIILMFRQGY